MSDENLQANKMSNKKLRHVGQQTSRKNRAQWQAVRRCTAVRNGRSVRPSVVLPAGPQGPAERKTGSTKSASPPAHPVSHWSGRGGPARPGRGSSTCASNAENPSICRRPWGPVGGGRAQQQHVRKSGPSKLDRLCNVLPPAQTIVGVCECSWKESEEQPQRMWGLRRG